VSARSYTTPEAFKRALEDRLRGAGAGGELVRRRQLLVFDRFLARAVAVLGDAVTLKGGLVVELRLARARTTKDVDLRLPGDASHVLERLRDAARRDLGDFLSFELRPDDEHPEMRNDGLPYGGLRFRAECRLAGKPYGRPFGVDVAFGDPMLGEPDVVAAPDVLAFAGVAPPMLRLYPLETHVAEKLHAYTLPRTQPNSRVKDLPDLALLASARSLHATRVRAALEQTFRFRATHPVPERLPDPPPAWGEVYAAMARESELAWTSLAQVTAAARAFLDPVLAAAPDGARAATWDPAAWTWRAG
jgi:hypothetical protein